MEENPEEIAVDAELFLAEMKGIFGERLEKFREALRDVKENRWGVVEIIFEDTRVGRLGIKKFVK